MSPGRGGPAGHFSDRLIEAVEKAGSPACIGLDPVLDRLPEAMQRAVGMSAEKFEAAAAHAMEIFCIGALEAIDGVAGVVKPQSACFERYGAPGVEALQKVCRAAKERGLVVILDAKRGDIGVSAEHYAAFAFEAMQADAVTVSAYMGADTVGPYLSSKWPGRGVFALVRTSNPGSDETQNARLEGGGTVAEHMGAMVARLGAERMGKIGWSDVGAVIAATKPQDAAAMRAAMPRQPFLVPGFGAQGGTAEDLEKMLAMPDRRVKGRAAWRGVVVNASRSVLYPFDVGPGDVEWQTKVRAAAERFAGELAKAMG